MAGGAFPGKYGRFENDYNHRTSLSKVIRLFENGQAPASGSGPATGSR